MACMSRILRLCILSPVIATAAIGLSGHLGSNVKEVSLERTPCFGGCPIYKVTIKQDGTIIYTGTRFVDRIGKYKTQVMPDTLKKISVALKRLEFNKLKSKYSLPITDQASQIVTVVSDTGTKTVSEYGHSGPAELWAVQSMIDGVLQNARGWEKIE